MKRFFRRLILFIAVAIVGVVASLLPLPEVTERIGTTDWNGQADGDVFTQIRNDYLRQAEPVLRKHCYACHVNQRFDRGEPWIAAYVAPLKDQVDKDISLGLAALDLSDGFPFSREGAIDLSSQPGFLANLDEVLLDESMPPWAFRAAHPLDPITIEERNQILEWSRNAQERLTGSPVSSGTQGHLTSKLREGCADCHGAGRTISGPEITDLSALAGSDWVDRAVPASSLILQVVRKGEMPPSGSPPAGLETALSTWLQAGLPLNDSARPVRSRDALLRAALGDLEKLPAGRRSFIRYFSAEHLEAVRNNPGEQAIAEDALRLVSSSLSHTPEVAQVHQISDDLALYRVDFSRTGLDRELLQLIEQAWPMNWRPSGSGAEDSRRIRELTGGNSDIIALDWFVRTTTLPPLYPLLMDIPEHLSDLAASLDIELCRLDGGMIRAGFRNSGVSAFNRLVERHKTLEGAFWISYDFGRRDVQADIFTNPFGPPCTGSKQAFVADGNELIWSLPNGLLAYGLYDADGRRLDVSAPREIVQDGREAITNANSCMGCHTGGLLPVSDEIRQDSRGNEDTIHALYVDDATMTRALEEDNREYLKGLMAAGISPLHHRPPVRVISNRYEQDVSLDEIAALLGETSPSVLSRLQHIQPDSPLAPLLNRTPISRVVLQRNFASLVEILNLGEAIPPTIELPFDDQERLALLPVREATSETIDYTLLQVIHEGTPLLMGATEITQGQWEVVMGEPPSLSCLTELLVQSFDSNITVRGEDLPVVCLPFSDAIAFANRLSRRDGLLPAYTIRDQDILLNIEANGYRLPTASEWRAALGGEGVAFAGKSPTSSVCGVGNVLSQSERDRVSVGSQSGVFPCEDGFGGLAPAASFEPTRDGIFDLTGNAAEWGWPSGESRTSTQLPHPLLGGSWLDGMNTAAATTARQHPGEIPHPGAGFRLVRSLLGERGQLDL